MATPSLVVCDLDGTLIDSDEALLAPFLALGVEREAIVFLGDTDHDRRCAAAAGVPFALAGWNPRATAEPGDLVLHRPEQVLDLLGLG